ncbi:uncharacterized protein LOC115718632 [Cannabis sativa]|uniref:DHHA1 domain-containing protein n=2 Tax=Cannabis sativa TaxID=3483 RepID=A0AB40ECA9_CANSA|nr:uncharacterized protein LOC115718632 [Cannabis sativa]XP_060965910.1 uncharacterized protein LOC115718632 [Cannabis sativa]KAF4355809.1 hypothetical protein G4B88_024979 [Cannabis sativa]KAF4379555.1 hypothetical protein F8388_023572 [Cannabis sativa]KAF4381055.1 hypothetical protein F8388_011977 [Cannabis sativa]
MAFSLLRKWKWRTVNSALPPWPRPQTFRSDAALEAIAKASQHNLSTIFLYNYPSFSGAFSALFAHLFHSRINLPCLILPFSSVEPLRVEDLCTEGLENLYLLDFFGPKGFAEALSRRASFKVIGFDHRKSVLPIIPSEEDCPANLKFHLNVEKSSSIAVYEYFSAKLSQTKHSDGMVASLLESKDQGRVEMILKHIEDTDLRRWSLPDTKAFNIGLDKWRSKLNCLTNPYMYEQLMEINSADLIAVGNSYISTREKAAEKLLNKAFKVMLGRGFYGECLGVRADTNSDLVDEIGKKLSVKSAAAGLRPIGAVIHMQGSNLKVCLRSTVNGIDTSEVAKAYGGGGSSSSSSFIIRMDEYNQWLSAI